MYALTLLVALALLCFQLISPTPASAAAGPIKQITAANVTADALPTAQIDGVVWSQAVVGDLVFAAGEFTHAEDVGSSTWVGRSNLMSYNITTGKLTSFAPVVDGRINALAISTDQKTLYVAGQFTHVNNALHQRFAAFDIATGAVKSYDAQVNAAVNAITVAGSSVYLGGDFNNVQGSSRTRLAAINGATGALTAWAPAADTSVKALAATPDRTSIIAGGSFTKLNTTTAIGMGALDATTGVVTPWRINTLIKDGGFDKNGLEVTAILSLTADADTVYGSGYAYGGGNFEGAFAADPSTGDAKWLQDCHGDTYSVAPIGDVVYSVGHAHFCSNIGGFPETTPRTWHRALAVTKAAIGTVSTNGQSGAHYGNFAGQKAPSMYNWFPDLAIGTYTGKNQAAWSISGNSQYVVMGGEFPKVNNVAQQGLVRFAVPAQATRKQGPRVSGAPSAPVATAVAESGVELSWPANWDRDDQVLFYDVVRSGRVLKSFAATSQFWNRPTLSYTDASGSAGKTYSYTIRARDASGNSVTSPAVAAVFPSDTAYARLIKADGATHQWRLGSAASSPTDPDGIGSATMTVGTGVTFGSAGAFAADADTAASFNGTSTAIARTNGTVSLPAGPLSVEAWFRTSSTQGGAIVGFALGDPSTLTAGDGRVYLRPDGRLTLAVLPTGATVPVTATSTASFNTGAWHQLVAVQSAAGLDLFVDGARMATITGPASTVAKSGAWVLAGPTPATLPQAPTGTLTATLDDVSVFPRALSKRQIRDHFIAGQPGYGVITGG